MSPYCLSMHVASTKQGSLWNMSRGVEILIVLSLCMFTGAFVLTSTSNHLGFLQPAREWRAPRCSSLESVQAIVWPASNTSTSPDSSEWPKSDDWAASLQPECAYHGSQHGLFEPSTPRPRYIVTGGAGFIGSHLVKRLAQITGPGQVKVVDNLWAGSLFNLQQDNGSWVIHPRKDVCSLDLRNHQHVLKFLRGADIIYHLATMQSTDRSGSWHLATDDNNYMMTMNIVRACKSNNITNLVYTSSLRSGPSASMAADPKSTLQTRMCDNLVAERHIQSANTSGINVGIIRLPHVYGPSATRAFNTTATSIADGMELLIRILGHQDAWLPDGSLQDTPLDLVFVSDVVDALVAVKDRGVNLGPIEISSGQFTSLTQLADAVARVTGSGNGSSVIKTLSYDSCPHRKARLANPRPAQQFLGWVPRTSLQQGLQETFKHIVYQRKKPHRVLVIITGQQRGGELAWKSLHKHLLKPYNAHLALLTGESAGNTTLLEHMSQYIWRIPEYSDWGVVFDQAAAECNTADGKPPNWRAMCQARPGLWAGGIADCKHESRSSVVLAFRWMVSRKMKTLNLHNHYDTIILTRPDLLYLCDHTPLKQLSSSYTWVPLGQDYGGVCDRHFVSRSGMSFLKAINTTLQLVCHPDRNMPLVQNGSINNAETVLANMWSFIGVQLQRFNASMFTVKTPEDPTSWSGGKEHPELSKFGILVKYLEELDSAWATCSTSNLTTYIESLQSYVVS